MTMHLPTHLMMMMMMADIYCLSDHPYHLFAARARVVDICELRMHVSVEPERAA